MLKTIYILRKQKEKSSEDQDQESSRVAQNVTSVISLRVAVLVMLCVVVSPFLQYDDVDLSQTNFLGVLNTILHTTANASGAFDVLNTTVHQFQASFTGTAQILLLLEARPAAVGAANKTYEWQWGEPVSSVVRQSNIEIVATNRIDATIDVGEKNRYDAGMSCLLMLFVIALLVAFAFNLTSVLQNTLIEPIRRILTTIREGAARVLAAAGADETALGLNKDGEDGVEDEADEDGPDEAGLLEVVASKITKLIARGGLGQQTSLDRIDDVVAQAGEDAGDGVKQWLYASYANRQGGERRASAFAGVADVQLPGGRGRRGGLLMAAAPLPVDRAVLRSWAYDSQSYKVHQLVVQVSWVGGWVEVNATNWYLKGLPTPSH